MLFSISEEEEEEEEEESEPDEPRPLVERPRKINAISSSCTHKTNSRIKDLFSLQIACAANLLSLPLLLLLLLLCCGLFQGCPLT
jgi:hypothetical protein